MFKKNTIEDYEKFMIKKYNEYTSEQHKEMEEIFTDPKKSYDYVMKNLERLIYASILRSEFLFTGLYSLLYLELEIYRDSKNPLWFRICSEKDFDVYNTSIKF